MKKIKLNKETVRNLDSRDMSQVHGGKPLTKGPDCTIGCDSVKYCDSVNRCIHSGLCDTVDDCL